MNADAYARARKLLDVSRGAVITARVLGVVHALLLLLLVLDVALLASLFGEQGEARYPTLLHKELPSWLGSKWTGQQRETTIYEDTGLFPIAAGNLHSASPIHRLAARAVLRLMAIVRPLQNNLGALTTLLAVGLALLLILSSLQRFRRNLIADAVSGVSATLRRLLHRQMYRLGQSSLPTEGTGPVINIITREVNDIRDALFADLDRGYRMPILAIGLVVIALAISWPLAIFLATLGLLVGWATVRMQREARLVSDAAVRDMSQHLILLHEDVGLIRTVRVFGMENIDKERFDEHLVGFQDADSLRMRTEGRLSPTTWLLHGIATAMGLGLLAYSVVISRSIYAGSALVLVACLVGMAPPVVLWLGLRKTMRQANRSAGGIFEFLDRRPELHQQGGAHFLPPLKERISFENVTLESRSGRVLLEGVSAEFPAGSRSAIMSLDEDAKHAMVCLIPRLIDPKVGSVRIDGHDLREVTLESIRAQVATILQADLLFTDSVTMNIGLGDPSFEMPRIIEAAKVAHAHHFIQDLPHGYDTVVGPLGHYLKPDEQYRLALARAYLHDPSIVIIEEPTAPLDEEIKFFVDDTVGRLALGRTLIILPHRLSTIRTCQQVIVLHNGKIEVAGNPRQLEQESKLFRHLQYLEFNQFATGEIEAGQMQGT
jgi:ATP-binding cassette subfamily B protein